MKNILIVEDERIVAKDIQDRLKNLGYTVPSVVSSGEKAIKRAEEDTPDLVLMDIVIKGRIDGVEAAQHIRNQLDIPVIFLTAYADKKTLEKAKMTEPYGYIVKPFEDRELHATIEIALYKHEIEKRIRKSEQWLSTTLRSIRDAVITITTGGVITFLNAAAETLTQWKYDDALGKSLNDVFCVSGQSGEQAKLQERIFRRENGLWALDLSLNTVDGTVLPIELSATPIKDEKERIMGAVIVFRDITEQKKAEEELRRAEKKFRDLFDNAGDPTLIHDREGKFLEVNKTACDKLHYTREELLQMQPADIESPHYAVSQEKRMDELERNNHIFFETVYLTKEGGEIPIEVSSRIIEYEGTPAVLSIARDITERKKAEEELRRIAWLISRGMASESTKKREYGMYEQPYGSLVGLNTCRLLVDSVGEEALADIVTNYLDLLDTSAAVYEKNGNYALGIFASGWCRFLDQASRTLCNTDDNKEALESGKWHCHESCWNEAAKVSMETGHPTDIECRGGIHIFAVPIRAGEDIVGSISLGYGDPPRDRKKLEEISERYHVAVDELVEQAESYESRPPFMIDLAKSSLITSVQLIGTLVEKKLAEEEKNKILHGLDERVKELSCLYSIDEIGRREIITVEELVGETVKIIPPSWQYPEITGCRITLKNGQYKIESATENFEETEWILRSDITVGNRKIGMIEVCYLDRRPPEDEGPFLPEERRLLTSISKRIGEFIERKKSEEALKRSEEEFRTIFENAKDAIFWTDPETGFIIKCNKAAEILLEKKREEIIGHHHSELHPPENAGLYRKIFENHVGKEGAEDVEAEVITQSGKIKPVHMTASFTLVGGKLISQGIFRDITEQKQAEKALRESEEKYRELVENINDVIYAVDEHGILTYVSPAIESVIGYTLSEITGHHFREFIHPEDLPHLKESFEMTLTGHDTTSEYRILAKSGEIRWMRTSSQPIRAESQVIGVQGVLVDITESKRAEMQLQNLFEASKLINSTMDMEDVFKSISDTVQELVGFDHFIIFLVSQDKQSIYPAYMSEEISKLMEGLTFDYGEGPVGVCIKTKEPVILESTEKEKFDAVQMNSQIVVPLVTGDECAGALHISRSTPNSYNQHDLTVLQLLSEVISSALRNSMLHSEIKGLSRELEKKVEDRSRRTEILLYTRHALLTELSWEKGLTTIVQSITELGLEKCGVFLVNPMRKTLDYHFGKGDGLPEKGTSLLLRDTEYYGVQCVTEKKTVYVRDSASHEGKQIVSAQSFVWIPIIVQGEAFAAIAAGNTSGKTVTEEDVKDLEILAGMCAVFIDRTRTSVEPVAEKRSKTEMKYRLDPSESYIIVEKKPHKAFEILVDLVTHGIPGFVVSREYPEKIKRKYELLKTPLLWLSRYEVENAVNPDDLPKLTFIIDDFTRKCEESVILLDGLEYLITQTEFSTVLKFVHELRDTIALHNSRLIIPLHRDTLSSNDYSILEREFTVLEYE